MTIRQLLDPYNVGEDILTMENYGILVFRCSVMWSATINESSKLRELQIHFENISMNVGQVCGK